jgi:diguanylate cyclase (GGDEF)-like protein
MAPQRASESVKTPAGGARALSFGEGPALRSEPSVELLSRFARILDPWSLRRAILRELDSRLPGARAFVSLTPRSITPDATIAEGEIRAWPPKNEHPAILAVPLVDDDETFGWVAYAQEGAEGSRHLQAIEALATVAAAASLPVRNAQRYAQAMELVRTDPLTGVANRRALGEILEREGELSRRFDRPLACMMADLDGFKLVNDEHGHAAGDAALRGFARRLAGSVRKTDAVVRLGGDEFLLLLPGADAAKAERLARRLETRLAREPVRIGPERTPVVLRASFGIADLDMAEGSPERLLGLADAALYRAKRANGEEAVRAREAPA